MFFYSGKYSAKLSMNYCEQLPNCCIWEKNLLKNLDLALLSFRFKGFFCLVVFFFFLSGS